MTTMTRLGGLLSDDDDDDNGAGEAPVVADSCERGVVEGECFDEFDLEGFDSKDVENFLRDEDAAEDEIET